MSTPPDLPRDGGSFWRTDLVRARQLVSAQWLALAGRHTAAAPAPGWRLFEVIDGCLPGARPGPHPGCTLA